MSSAKFQEISSDFIGDDLYGQISRVQDVAAILPIIVRLSRFRFDRINNAHS
jgi:hypothetical protein